MQVRSHPAPKAAPAPAPAPGTVSDETLELQRGLLERMSPERLRSLHDVLAGVPHRAGTAGDRQVVDALVQAFTEMGLEVERHPIDVYLPSPVSAELQLVGPERLDLPLQEVSLDVDADTRDAGLDHGWNAYSGSGDVTAEVVYANYGTKEDFEQLAELGVLALVGAVALVGLTHALLETRDPLTQLGVLVDRGIIIPLGHRLTAHKGQAQGSKG